MNDGVLPRVAQELVERTRRTDVLLHSNEAAGMGSR